MFEDQIAVIGVSRVYIDTPQLLVDDYKIGKKCLANHKVGVMCNTEAYVSTLLLQTQSTFWLVVPVCRRPCAKSAISVYTESAVGANGFATAIVRLFSMGGGV